MDYSPEEYTRYYIVQALFKLMKDYDFERISVTDIAEKAGVGRATFYRYFKRKEDVLVFYFDHNSRDFAQSQHYYPRCKEDYKFVVKKVLTKFKENKEPFKLIRKARLEYIYLDYLNSNFKSMFESEYPQNNNLTPYLYAGMLFNVSMAWLDNDCDETVDELADTIINAIFNE